MDWSRISKYLIQSTDSYGEYIVMVAYIQRQRIRKQIKRVRKGQENKKALNSEKIT